MRRLAIAAALGLLVAACATPAEPGGTPPAEQPGGTAAVTIADFAYDPATTNVTVGTTVTWTNDDSVAHTVTFDAGPDSGNMSQGSNFSNTFSEAGSFAYHCTIHPSMSGTVSVGN